MLQSKTLIFPTFSLVSNTVPTVLIKQKEKKKNLSEHQAHMHQSQSYPQEDVWNKQTKKHQQQKNGKIL